MAGVARPTRTAKDFHIVARPPSVADDGFQALKGNSVETRNLAQELLSEALAVLSLPPPIAYEGGGAWQVDLDEGRYLDVEYDDSLRRLVITGGIGAAAEHARPALYETLLQYNFIWTETGGVRMAVDASTNQVVMMFEVAVSELDTSKLAMVLGNMAASQRGWQEIVRDCSFAGEPGA